MAIRSESERSPSEAARQPRRGVDHRGFWKILERFAGTLVDRYDLDDVLEQLGADIAAVLDVAGAGIMLADGDGRLRFRSTSNTVLLKLEALQIALDEGPCLLAYRSGLDVLADRLRTDPRFPTFGPQAHEAGMAAVFSFPMRFEGDVIGALNLYTREPAEFTEDQIEVGRVLANVGTMYLLNARVSAHQHLLVQQLEGALRSRVLIEQAKGFVAGIAGIAPDDAFEHLRGYARRHQTRLRGIAEAVIDRTLPVEELLHES